MGSITNVDVNSFEKEIIEHQGLVLVDFWADWCGPCRIQFPILEEILEDFKNIKICKINVDENVNLAIRYGIKNIPTMIIFKSGEKINQFVGFKNREELFNKLNML